MLYSPVARLPHETLAYIFELCLARERESTPVFVPSQVPFCLAQVCKLWRAIVGSDPHLWTSIRFYFPHERRNREEDVPRIKPVFDLYLKRSGALPISLTYTDHRCYEADTEYLVSLLVDRLRTHSRRWKRISLRLSCGYFPLLFKFMPCDLSSLEHLDISGDVLGQQVVTTLCLNLDSAKNLKSFAYSGPSRSLVDKIDLHWERLAEIAFEFAPHNGTSSTLSRQLKRLVQCQNITTCSLGIDRPFWLDLAGNQTITLPSLRTLRVRRLSTTQSHARTVIDPLILPGLQTLEIDAAIPVGWDGRNAPNWHNRNFSNLLARSGCALRRLSIQDVDFPNDEVVRCLALSPTLTSFRFIPSPRPQNIADVIRKLCVSEPAAQVGSQTQVQARCVDGEKHVGDSPLVPGLREIALASSVEGYLDLMMAMCRSRGGACARAAEVATLRRVEVVFFDMSHGTDVARGNSVPGDRLRKVTGFRQELARWASENDGNEKQCGGERVETSVVVDSLYLVEYVGVM